MALLDSSKLVSRSVKCMSYVGNVLYLGVRLLCIHSVQPAPISDDAMYYPGLLIVPEKTLSSFPCATPRIADYPSLCASG